MIPDPVTFTEIWLVICPNPEGADNALGLDITAFLSEENARVEMIRMQGLNPEIQFTLLRQQLVDQ